MPQPGDLVPSTAGGWMEYPPPPFHSNRLVGWQPCMCGGHRTWECTDCRTVVYVTRVSGGCRKVTGDGR